MKLLQKLFGLGAKKPSLETRIQWIKQQVDSQGQHGNWNCNAYMHGMYNGLECALATLENRPPEYRSAPTTWLDDLCITDPPVAVELWRDPSVNPYVEKAKIRLRSTPKGKIYEIAAADAVEDVYLLKSDDGWTCRYSLEEMYEHWEVVPASQAL